MAYIGKKPTDSFPSQNAITSLLIAENNITAREIASNSISANELADNSIVSDKIAQNSVDASEIKTDAVRSLHIQDDAVTADQIATLTGHVLLNDNAIIKLGTAQDLQIYHDGTNSAIQNTTGDLFIYGGTNEVRIRAVNNEEGIVVEPNGAVDLYYDNVKKFETTSAGATVTGLSFSNLAFSTSSASSLSRFS